MFRDAFGLIVSEGALMNMLIQASWRSISEQQGRPFLVAAR